VLHWGQVTTTVLSRGGGAGALAAVSVSAAPLTASLAAGAEGALALLPSRKEKSRRCTDARGHRGADTSGGPTGADTSGGAPPPLLAVGSWRSSGDELLWCPSRTIPVGVLA